MRCDVKDVVQEAWLGGREVFWSGNAAGSFLCGIVVSEEVDSNCFVGYNIRSSLDIYDIQDSIRSNILLHTFRWEILPFPPGRARFRHEPEILYRYCCHVRIPVLEVGPVRGQTNRSPGVLAVVHRQQLHFTYVSRDDDMQVYRFCGE